MDWFPYDSDLRHEWVKIYVHEIYVKAAHSFKKHQKDDAWPEMKYGLHKLILSIWKLGYVI